MTYLQWIGIFWGIPLLGSLIIAPKIFPKYKNIFFKIIIGVVFVGLPADIIAVNLNLWSFPTGLSGLYFLSLPIEEYFWTVMYTIIVVFLTLYFLDKHTQ